MAEIKDTVFPEKPEKTVSARKTFGIDFDMDVPAFAEANEYVPVKDDAYRFDDETTRSILAGFAHNRRVMVQGYHGTGKSTHIEQIAARLNWPCIRDQSRQPCQPDRSHRQGRHRRRGRQVQITQLSSEGILPWAFQRPVALVFDEYDAGRPDVMFVIQRILEAEGRLTLLDQNKRALTPNPWFPPLRNDQHDRPWRHDRPLSRDTADQPGSDGPLVRW